MELYALWRKQRLLVSDGQQIWDSNPTRACNQAIPLALPVAQSGTDKTPPTIYLPQRTSYNPGGT